jgi:uncharacterized membrane protein YkvA (DUF1232 family)
MSVLETIKGWADRFRAQLLTLWFCRSHPRTPLAAKILAALVVAYAFSPIDLIPDFIPVLGYLDDALLLPALIWLAIRLLPEEVVAQSRAKAETWMREQGGKPTSKAGALLVIAAWAAAAYLCWRWLA